MLKRTIIITLLLFTVLAFAVSCKKKYPDGPPFSLTSKKKRVSSEWKLSLAKLNGEDKTSYEGFATCWLTIEEDHEYSVNWEERTKKLNTIGKWRWVDNKRSIGFTCDLWFYKLDASHTLTLNTYNNSNNSPELVYRITRLTNKELWINHTNEYGDKVELRFNAVTTQ